MKNNEKSRNLGQIEVHTGGGNLEKCDLIKRSRLIKHDRYIDYDTIITMMTLTHAEMLILLSMFNISSKANLVFEIKTDLTERTISSALKVLTEKHLIRKVLIIKSIRKSVKAWMINPHFFRKTRQTEEFIRLQMLYDSKDYEDILIIT